MIKVAITDDHPMVLAGLRQMLEGDHTIKLCGLWGKGSDLRKGIAEAQPDVLLLDLQLPDISGEVLAEELLRQFSKLKILILTSLDNIQKVRSLIRIGCAGYSLKNVSRESLLLAIETVYNGGAYIDPILKEELLRDSLKKKTSGTPEVTKREKEILLMLKDGNSSQQIAEKFYLSIRTVENHRKNLLHKFDVKNSLALLKAAQDFGVID